MKAGPNRRTGSDCAVRSRAVAIPERTEGRGGRRKALLAAGGLAVAIAASAASALAGTFTGTPGADRLEGTNRPDLIKAGAGHDVLIGKGSRDTLRAGRGADHLRAGEGGDVLKGAAGDDVLRARWDGQDRLFCGPGHDIALVGHLEDGVYDCEEVRGP